jgi:hypothetical protein
LGAYRDVAEGDTSADRPRDALDEQMPEHVENKKNGPLYATRF